MVRVEIGVVLWRTFVSTFNTIFNITQEPQDLQRHNRACRFIVKSAVIKYHHLLSKVTSINRKFIFDQLTTASSSDHTSGCVTSILLSPFNLGLGISHKEVIVHDGQPITAMVSSLCLVKVYCVTTTVVNPRLTNVFFVTRLTNGGVVATPLNFRKPRSLWTWFWYRRIGLL